MPSLDVGTGIDSPGVILFVERAHGLAPHFSWPTQEADAVVEICQRLDGIPLAIELAASRMASMTAVRCVIGWITGSGCWSDHGAAWNATTRCATRWRGLTTCSRMRRSRCWSGVRCSPVDLTSKALAP